MNRVSLSENTSRVNFSCGTLGIGVPLLLLCCILVTERVFAQQVHTGCDSVAVMWMQQGDTAVIKYQILPRSEKIFDVSLIILVNNVPATFEARHLSGAVGRGKYALSKQQITWSASLDIPSDYDNEPITFEVVVREVAAPAPVPNNDVLAEYPSSERPPGSEPALKEEHEGGGLSWWMYVGTGALLAGGAALFLLQNTPEAPSQKYRLPDPPSTKPD